MCTVHSTEVVSRARSHKRVSPSCSHYHTELQSNLFWQIMISELQRHTAAGYTELRLKLLTPLSLSPLTALFLSSLLSGPLKCLLMSATHENALCIWIANCIPACFYVSGEPLYFYDCKKEWKTLQILPSFSFSKSLQTSLVLRTLFCHSENQRYKTAFF